MLNRVRLSLFYVFMGSAIALQIYPIWFVLSDTIQYHALSFVSGLAYGSVLTFSIPSFVIAVVCLYRMQIKPPLSVWVAGYLFLHVIPLLMFFLMPSHGGE
ncbi:hypothetical protein AAKU55_002488 [Oxalobacteraceae bacterium GrIS 1.11]